MSKANRPHVKVSLDIIGKQVIGQKTNDFGHLTNATRRLQRLLFYVLSFEQLCQRPIVLMLKFHWYLFFKKVIPMKSP